MRIYKMTATFGVLEHRSLVLEPGLNVIHAPNEWGKSTWCAFLLAMFYGLDTRAKSTKTTLADKERYAPWSGSPMSGRMDLCWQGRDITIERSSRGRIPLGEFRAYETDTGLPVPELTADNCGRLLLGAEQSVFRRAGFIRLSDMPVTADEALRRRLNALVTTGDESGDADRLEKGLKDLRNRCRYNRSGLLPQAEAERDALEKRLRELEGLQLQSKKIGSRLAEAKSWARELENHRDSLIFAQTEADAARAAQARDTWEEAEKRLLELEAVCAKLPKQEEAERKIREIRTFQRNWEAARLEAEKLPEEPKPPEIPRPFQDMPIVYAREMVETDIPRYDLLKTTKPYLLWLIFAAVSAFLGAVALVTGEYRLGIPAGVVALLLLIPGLIAGKRWRWEAAELERKYGTADPGEWERRLESYEQALWEYGEKRKEYRSIRVTVDEGLEALEKQRQSLCAEQNPEYVLEIWQAVLEKWTRYHTLCRDTEQARAHYETVSAMLRPAKPPGMTDELTYSAEETQELLEEAAQEQQRLLGRLGQYRGRMEALGEPDALMLQLKQVEQRIAKLEAMYAAAQLGLDTLSRARQELQRRFAPRITRRAQQLLESMTEGRYQRLTLGEDFRLRTASGEEDILREALWRSDGTVDQLYLALRLAVAEELTPEAPLVLDDALVRFDETRLKAAMDILREMAKEKQILLFSCQDREKKLVSG